MRIYSLNLNLCFTFLCFIRSFFFYKLIEHHEKTKEIFPVFLLMMNNSFQFVNLFELILVCAKC